jgi:hypothetical protein
MKGSSFDEKAFFVAISRINARALLIGRRAMVVLGLPVMTADYDFWLHPEDIESFNAALEPFGLYPSCSPKRARASGRYVLENDEHIDVIVARKLSTMTRKTLLFEQVWNSRIDARITKNASVRLPNIDDLIATKQIAARPKDIEDTRLLMVFKNSKTPKR